MLIRLNIPKFDFIVYFYVLCPSMEYGVLGESSVVDVVVVDQDWGWYLDPQVLQQSPKPNGFTSSNNSATIFSLTVRKSNYWLLFAASRNNRATKGKHVTGGGSAI